MPIPGPIRNFLALAAIAALGVTAVQAQTTTETDPAQGSPIAPTKVTVSSDSKNEFLTKGETIELTSDSAAVSTFYSGVFNFFFEASGHVVSLTFDVRDVGRYNGDYVEGQTYETVSGLPVNGGPKGAYFTASVDGRGCNQDLATKGKFEIQDYEWRVVYIPKGAPAGDEDPVTKKRLPLLKDKRVGFAITRFKAAAELHCDGAPELFKANLDFYGKPPLVPEFGLVVVGPAGDNCFDPRSSQIGTGGSCSATPGGGDTGGSVGGPVPTLPPLPPPPDVNIVLPSSLGDLPRIQLSNNGTGSFKFTTTPASDSINAPVFFSITSDANDADNFNVSVTPDHFDAPGIGEATVNISIGPNTFPRDYVVTLTAAANGKTANSVFIVSVPCDPPQILGIDQPQSQRVTRGSTATLSVKGNGSGPYSYQWYNGRRGNTRLPVAGATNASFTTPAVDGESNYWVRVSNACGTVDSATVNVAPR